MPRLPHPGGRHCSRRAVAHMARCSIRGFRHGWGINFLRFFCRLPDHGGETKTLGNSWHFQEEQGALNLCRPARRGEKYERASEQQDGDKRANNNQLSNTAPHRLGQYKAPRKGQLEVPSPFRSATVRRVRLRRKSTYLAALPRADTCSSHDKSPMVNHERNDKFTTSQSKTMKLARHSTLPQANLPCYCRA